MAQGECPVPPSFYCRWWFAKTGQYLKACLVPWWNWGVIYAPRPWWWGGRPRAGEVGEPMPRAGEIEPPEVREAEEPIESHGEG